MNNGIKIFILSLFFILSLNFTLAKTCSNDLQCKDLEGNITLDQTSCIGQASTFENIYGQFFGNITTGATIPYLMDKQYTEQIQTGYTLKYGCVNKQCQVVKREPITKKCAYGCLVTPTAYEGKDWHDFCICKPGWDKDDTGNPIMHCGPNGSRYAYYLHIVWTCEKEDRVAGICEIGQRCVEKPTEVTCEDIPGSGPIQYPDGTTYTFIIPKKSSSQIYVTAIQNGKVIASKPISNLSAMEYIAKNGPVNASQALAFAQSTGLTTTLASAKNTVTTPSASITALYNPYKTTTYTPRTTNTYNPYKPTSNTVQTNTRTYTPPTKTYSSYPTVYTRTSTPTASLYAVKSATPRIVSYATTYTKPTTTTPYYTKRVVNPSSSTVPTRTVAVTNAYKRFA